MSVRSTDLVQAL